MSSVRIPIEERFRRPALMGVLNVTPDSFSDGGQFVLAAVAIEHGRKLVEDGADLVDVGGESTRPGAEAVSLEEELRRVTPVLEGLQGLPVSIDTTKAPVARVALELGAEMVNDVSAFRKDPSIASLAAEHGSYVCLMHMQGDPGTMQVAPRYDDVVSEVAAFLEERLEFAVSEGIDEELVCLDPGIGFGKTADQNLELIRGLDRLIAIGRPVLVGFSRKSTLAMLTGDRQSKIGALPASLGAAVACYHHGAWMLRVHDLKETAQAIAVAAAVERGRVTA